MRSRPVADASRPSGVEMDVRATRGHEDLPPFVLGVEPSSVRDAWGACWRYADDVADGEPGVAVALMARFPRLVRAEILERLDGLDYSAQAVLMSAYARAGRVA